MLHYHCEEPLYNNSSLYSLDEATRQYTLASGTEARLNRYTLRWIGTRQDAEAAFTRFFHHFYAADDTICTWCIVRGYPRTSFDHTRSRAWLSWRQHEQWTTYIDTPFAIATKPYADVSNDLFPLAHPLRPLEGQPFVFVGALPPLPLLAHSPARPTLEAATTHKSIAPSIEMIRWLADLQLTLVYRVDEEFQRFRLVIISPQKLDIDDIVGLSVVRDDGLFE